MGLCYAFTTSPVSRYALSVIWSNPLAVLTSVLKVEPNNTWDSCLGKYDSVSSQPYPFANSLTATPRVFPSRSHLHLYW